MARRALIVGQWPIGGVLGPKSQTVQALLRRWDTATSAGGVFPCLGVDGTAEGDRTFENISWVEFVQLIEDAPHRRNDEEFLFFYFFGHALPGKVGEANLEFKGRAEKSASYRSSAEVIREIERLEFERVIVVIDSCHAGRTRPAFADPTVSHFFCSSTGTRYTQNAEFTETFLTELERPIRRNDFRIDFDEGGITIGKLVGRCKVQLRRRGVQDTDLPRTSGDLTNTVVRQVSGTVSSQFNPLAATSSVYGRTHSLIEFISENDLREEQLFARLGNLQGFRIRKGRGEGAEDEFVGRERITEYLNFLEALGWITRSAGRLSCSERGREAAEKEMFNDCLLKDIERSLLAPEITLQRLKACVLELTSNSISASPSNIREYLEENGTILELSTNLRIALNLLRSSGLFLSGGADALYPSPLQLEVA
ncbi:MAG: hypothetical protein ACE37J_10690 [Pikeienuella sp.]|uniref:hypothetical protein n=1 Tax=Pikeienuella sp. TaxID=2831957 RepID=UPI00391ACD9E